MRLYLASYAKDIIKTILQHDHLYTSGKTAVFIPMAGDPYDNKDFVIADKTALQDIGFMVIELDIKKHSLDKIRTVISQADLVLVAGGDTFYLLNQLKQTNADQVIKDYVSNNGLYIGSSAGSIICCDTIEGAAEFDDPALAPNLVSYTGLQLFPNIIIPHAQKEKYHERIECATQKLTAKNYQVFPLTDAQALFYDGVNTLILSA